MLQVLALLQSRQEWTGPQLADRLQVTERTVRRDIDRLRELGYGIDSTIGSLGGYRLEHGTGVPPLLLSPDEAVAVAVALRGSAVSGLNGLDETAVLALAKLEQSLPSMLRARIQAIQNSVLTLTGPGPIVNVEVLLTAASAIREHRQLHAQYRTHSGAVLARVLEPHRIVRVTDRWYLIAWDVTVFDWRTLRLDRLVPRLPLGTTFAPHDIDDAAVAAAVADGITSRPYRWRTTMTVIAPAEAVGELVSVTRGRVTRVDAATSLVTGGGDDLAAMALWITGLPFEVIVHEPIELREHLEQVATRARRAARGLTEGDEK